MADKNKEFLWLTTRQKRRRLFTSRNLGHTSNHAIHDNFINPSSDSEESSQMDGVSCTVPPGRDSENSDGDQATLSSVTEGDSNYKMDDVDADIQMQDVVQENDPNSSE